MSGRAIAAVLAVVLLLLPASAAGADFGFVPGSVEVSNLDAEDQAETRAGAHPDRLITRFEVAANSAEEVEENAKTITVDLPKGIAGNPLATPRCEPAQFAQGSCPAETQVGVIRQTFALLGQLSAPIYNVDPGGKQLGAFGFTAFILSSRFAVGLRADGDFGVRLQITDIPQEIPVLKSETELWGVPADHQSETSIPRRALLTNPTHCEASADRMRLSIATWQKPDEPVSASAPIGPFTECENLPFAPELSFAASHDSVDSPTGAEIELELPQDEDPDGVATAHIREAAVTLPAGFSLSPGVAHGLSACSDSQLGAPGAPAACPDAAKLGTAELINPALAAPLRGGIYLGEPTAAQPFRLFVAVDGPGFAIKLRGALRANPIGGRLTAVLGDLPELPVSRLSLRFKDGPRAPLASAPSCGAGTAVATLDPYGGEDATVADRVVLGTAPWGGPCRPGAPFRPSFVAGTSPATAGADSAFSTTIGRQDGEQSLAGLELELPSGLAARLTAATACGEHQLAGLSCPAASAIGTTAVEAGAGPMPLSIGGQVYLTGPYRGAPFGLALALRARVGPFDLGTALVRAALSIHPFSGRITISTDPLPRVLAGIPLRLRTLAIDINRPGFIFNPTSCADARVGATITSADGAAVWPSTAFGLAGCRRLRFKPRLAVTLVGRASRRPSIAIRLRTSRGEANARAIAVKLPRLLSLDRRAGASTCPPALFRAGNCPATSRVGGARARTSLLARPLRGPVHLIEAGEIGPPELWTLLRGQGVELIVRSRIAVTGGGRVRTKVIALPDLPLGFFAMRIAGGRRALLKARTRPCAANPKRMLIAAATLRAQNRSRLKRLMRVGVRPGCRRGASKPR